MEKTNESQIDQGSKKGTIKISEEVVATIAGLAAAEVVGVAGMSGGLAGDLVEKLGRKTCLRELKPKWEKKKRS
jgi:uncharacterized alkaline shock family protein YloU